MKPPSPAAQPEEGDVEAALAAMPEDETPPAPAERPWLLMDDAPKDGTIIETKADPDDPEYTAVHATWRTTRVRATPPQRGWAIASFWADPLTKQRLHPEPFVFRMLEGNVLPVGMQGQM